MSKMIIFTGGGSGGHAMPAITMIEYMRTSYADIDILYIGSKDGIEKKLCQERNIAYRSISSGKWRRYFSLQNFVDLFKIASALMHAFFILLPLKKRSPTLFSTGGYVALPVVIAAYLLQIKIVIHEQTTLIGLTNKISAKLAKHILLSFLESLAYFPARKSIYTGYPLRNEIFAPEIAEVTIKNLTLNKIEKPILFVTGGGNGSLLINQLIQKYKEEIGEQFFIVHQVGHKFFTNDPPEYNYLSFDFSNQIIDIIKMSTLVVTRSGAGIVSELIALGKKAIFIPLKHSQNNEQLNNARLAAQYIPSLIIEEEQLQTIDLNTMINKLLQEKSVPPNLVDARSKIASYLL